MKLSPNTNERNAAPHTADATIEDLESAGHAHIAQGHALLSKAASLRKRPIADELLDRSRVEAEYPFHFRLLSDAARRGEIVLEHAGRKPVVRRSSLDAWVASRPTHAIERPGPTDTHAEDRAAFARTVARVAGAR